MNKIPFTYLIKNKTTNQLYYGVRYGNGCHPDNFWKDYFTSSKKVKTLIEKYGVGDFEYEIRKTFTDKISAISWESKVLSKMGVLYKDNWLNDNVAKVCLMTDRRKKQISKKMKNRIRTKEHCENLSNSLKGRKLSEEHKDKLSKVKRGIKPNHSGTTGMTPWNKGISCSDEIKMKISKSVPSKHITDGKHKYRSIVECAKKTGLHVNTIRYRLKNKKKGGAG